MSKEYIAVVYTESHPDKDQTFLGIFSTMRKAEAAMKDHMSEEKTRLPRASIHECNYSFFQGEVDRAQGWWRC